MVAWYLSAVTCLLIAWYHLWIKLFKIKFLVALALPFHSLRSDLLTVACIYCSVKIWLSSLGVASSITLSPNITCY